MVKKSLKNQESNVQDIDNYTRKFHFLFVRNNCRSTPFANFIECVANVKCYRHRVELLLLNTRRYKVASAEST